MTGEVPPWLATSHVENFLTLRLTTRRGTAGQGQKDLDIFPLKVTIDRAQGPLTVTIGVSLAKKPRYPMYTIVPQEQKISLLLHLMRHTAENQL